MMTISATVERHLADAGVDYDIISHDHTGNSISTALAAHVSVNAMAKAVVLKDAEGYLMAITSATCKLSDSEIYDAVGRRLRMVDEDELAEIFSDCDPGAVPPLAAAYGMEAVWDDSLAHLKDIYFEGGDHDNVVHMGGDDFRRLLGDARRAHFSHHI
jgi:Ala-tRNA(Pro) deacylase